MNILGIETSCDETGAAVVKNGTEILSNVIATSLKEHEKYGGVIPEIASRRQLECINAVTNKALVDAKITLKRIDAIAVTAKPGLIGSLLVGTSFAKALAFALNKPLIELDHIKAHLYASFLTSKKEKDKKAPPGLPVIGLVVSGGHTSLYKINSFKNFKLLGHALDDAAGEAFDKVAKILELGYPGGPVIDKVSRLVADQTLNFNCAELPGSYNFSFSGIKTAILYYCRQHKNDKNFSKENIAYAFQKSIASILVKKSIDACRKNKISNLVLGGGVAANSFLRKMLLAEALKYRIRVDFPPLILCTDNAAMIAGLGYHYLKGNSVSPDEAGSRSKFVLSLHLKEES